LRTVTQAASPVPRHLGERSPPYPCPTPPPNSPSALRGDDTVAGPL
jgi:hypothetical protein